MTTRKADRLVRKQTTELAHANLGHPGPDFFSDVYKAEDTRYVRIVYIEIVCCVPVLVHCFFFLNFRTSKNDFQGKLKILFFNF